jgi:transcriptional regulator with XRE-family HTH domain
MTPAEFRSVRERLGLTQAAFASALGLAQSSVSDFERGVRIVPRVVELACYELERRWLVERWSEGATPMAAG